jgi:hypothetical protein
MSAIVCRCGNGQMCLRIVTPHVFRLMSPVLKAVLEDAQGVDPDISEAKSPGQVDGIAEDQGKIVYVNTVLMSFQTVLGRTQEGFVAPTVAECHL